MAKSYCNRVLQGAVPLMSGCWDACRGSNYKSGVAAGCARSYNRFAFQHRAKNPIGGLGRLMSNKIWYFCTPLHRVTPLGLLWLTCIKRTTTSSELRGSDRKLILLKIPWLSMSQQQMDFCGSRDRDGRFSVILARVFWSRGNLYDVSGEMYEISECR